MYPIDAEDADGLLKAADGAMFAVKRAAQGQEPAAGRSQRRDAARSR